MKTFLECTDLAAREIGDTGFKNWLIFKLDDEQLEHLERAAVIYAEQSKSHIPVVGGPGPDVRSEGEQLGNEAGAKSVREGKVINMQERERQEIYKKILKRGE